MSNSFISNEWACNILGDLFSVYIALFGCLVSVFTLLYSFMIAKKDDLKIYADLQAHGDKSPTIIQRQRFAANYIRRMNKALNLCIKLMLCSALLSFASWIGVRFLEGDAKIILLYIVGGFTLLFCIFISILCVKVFRQYLDDVSI